MAQVQDEQVLASWKGQIFERDDPNTFRIVATKDGAHCFTANGLCLTFSAASLEPAAPSWVGGTVSINHDLKKGTFGEIVDSVWSKDSIVQTIKVNDFLAGWIARNKDHIGVSVEATVRFNGELVTTHVVGTGVTIVFPPEKPACPIEEGCGILGTDPSPVTLTESDSTQILGEPNMTEVSANEKEALDKLAKVEATLTEKEATLATATKRIGDLEAKVKEQADIIATYVEKEKADIMATLKEAMGEEAAAKFADKPICTLRDIAVAATAFVAKIKNEEPQGSGATLMDRSESTVSTDRSTEDPLAVQAAQLEKEYAEMYGSLDKE